MGIFNAFLKAAISPFSVFLGRWKKVTGIKFSRLKFYKSVFTYSIAHFNCLSMMQQFSLLIFSLTFYEF